MWAFIKSIYKTYTPAQKRVAFFCGVLLLGMLAALSVMGVNLLMAKAYFPNITFLFDPRYRFSDFYDVAEFTKLGLNIYHQQGPNYFPFFMVLLLPIKYLNWQAVLWGMQAAFVGFYVFLTYRLMPKISYKAVWTGIFTLCSYPLWFVLDRGNVEMLLFIVLGLFIWAYKAGKLKTAGCLLALAINMKLYLAVFLVLFAADKKYKELFFTFFLSVAFFATGFCLTGAWDGLGANLEHFAFYHQQRPFGLQFSHSLMNLIRVPVFLLCDGGLPETWAPVTHFSAYVAVPYMLFMFALFALISLYVIFINKEFWKAVLLLTLAEVGFPFVSSDYTLIHLAVPILLLFNARPQNGPQKAVCVLLALLMMPLNWWAHTYYMSHYAMVLNAGSILRPLIIILLLVLLMRDFTFKRLKQGMAHYLQSLSGKTVLK